MSQRRSTAGSVSSTCLGYPRIGQQRELKRALEGYWAGRLQAGALMAAAADLRERHWRDMREAGLAQVPCNDFSFYDHVLDMAVTVGIVPARFAPVSDPLARYFAMARGLQDPSRGFDIPALEMTKWFDTNYHYIVPELADHQRFSLDATAILAALEQAASLGLEARPVLLGPVSLLALSKMDERAPAGHRPVHLLPRLLPVYVELLDRLAARGVAWVQLDEPCLVTDLDAEMRAAYDMAFTTLTAHAPRPRLLLTTYFGACGGNLDLAAGSGCDGLHLDLVRAPGQLSDVLAAVPATMTLSLGVVDGRNIWRTDLDRAHAVVRRVAAERGAARVWVSSSCSLLHAPVDLAAETSLDAELASWLAFARQKLDEIAAVAAAAESDVPAGAAFEQSRAAQASRLASPRTHAPAVRDRAAAVTDAMSRRTEDFAQRASRQAARLALPQFPTTTIGSFPQTREIRDARAAWRAGRMDADAYQAFLEAETRACLARQDALGLDVLVHGEFERTDMVEYFGEQLDGFAFTANGWVQSYGSRCVKPPVLFGDVARPRPMTVAWARYAQSLTGTPVKGMLTGPVTILQWSFVRDDQPRRDTCLQIALALRDEVRDLEAAGIAIIQVDEPAIREGLPLRRAEWDDYLGWAVSAFRLSTSGAAPETQIHTHMCYSEFGDILPAVAAMDADVLSIETSRSRMELLRDFATFKYPNAIGPGVYDIHSPRVPTVAEMQDLLRRAVAVVPAAQLWINPDCGLKTRGWVEVEEALRNMVSAARQLRADAAAEVQA